MEVKKTFVVRSLNLWIGEYTTEGFKKALIEVKAQTHWKPFTEMCHLLI